MAPSRDPMTSPWRVGRMVELALPGQNDVAALRSAGRLLDGETGRQLPHQFGQPLMKLGQLFCGRGRSVQLH